MLFASIYLSTECDLPLAGLKANRSSLDHITPPPARRTESGIARAMAILASETTEPAAIAHGKHRPHMLGAEPREGGAVPRSRAEWRGASGKGPLPPFCSTFVHLPWVCINI